MKFYTYIFHLSFPTAISIPTLQMICRMLMVLRKKPTWNTGSSRSM